jgi:hypothetical protein
MKFRLCILLLAVCLCCGCVTQKADHIDFTIAGVYRAQVPGYTSLLVLSTHGQYHLTRTLFDGTSERVSGEETGRWSRDKIGITLIPVESRGEADQQDRLRRLFPVENSEGSVLLVSAIEKSNIGDGTRIRVIFLRTEVALDDALQREIPPNKSLQPTATAVTPPAGQEARQP